MAESATMTNEQEVTYSFEVVDGRGRAVEVDGEPTVNVSDSTVLLAGALTQDGPGKFSGTIMAVAPGEARAVIEVDGKLGEEVHTLTGIIDFVVTQDTRSEDRTLKLTVGTPTDMET